MPLPYELKAVGPIATPEEARTFIRLLHKHERSFHFDDDPADIVRGKDGEQLFAFEFDPFAFARTPRLGRLPVPRVAGRDVYAQGVRQVWLRQPDSRGGMAMSSDNQTADEKVADNAARRERI